MNMSKSIVASFGTIICVVITGCNGYYAPTFEESAEMHSLIQDLEAIVLEHTGEAPPITQTDDNIATNDNNNDDDSTSQDQNNNNPIEGQLTWEPASFYEDGTTMPLNEIAYYEIVFGTSESNLTESVELNIAGLLTYDFSASSDNHWFVGVKTVSIYGSVSDVSNLVEFNI